MTAPARAWLERDGRLLRLRLSRPKANVLDAAMIGAISAALDTHLCSAGLRGVMIDAEGPHFSFGASVEEHLPQQCAAMLQRFHGLIVRLLESPVPVLLALRGQCLGGGLELACAGHVLFAAADAQLGQPEISLAVFAPAASCLLPERIGRARAEDLLISGRAMDAAQARECGLLTAVVEDPGQAALEYFEAHLCAKSASSLRFAVRAARAGMVERVKEKLASLEALYLDELMRTPDAAEGLRAFLEKRSPVWESL